MRQRQIPVTCKVCRQQEPPPAWPARMPYGRSSRAPRARLPAGGAGRAPAPEVERAARQLCLPADGERQGP
eukprot:6557133-Lingulodinium_polyedra.AAC.1